MNKLLKAFFAFVVLLSISSCSSMNNLHKYELEKKGFYIEKLINMKLSTVRIHMNYNPPKQSIKDSSNTSILNPTVAYDIIFGVGAAVKAQMINDRLSEKISRAIQLDGVVDILSDKMIFTLDKYYNIRQVNTFSDDCEFVLTTYLEDCGLVIDDNASVLSVEVRCLIEERKTGEIVWRNSESHNVVLRSSSYIENKKYPINSILNFPLLISLSEEEIRSSVYNATNYVANEMAETFKEDFRNSNAKKSEY